MSDLESRTSLSEQELRLASLWVRHQFVLRRAGFIILLLILVLEWAYVGWTIIDSFILSAPREARIPSLIARSPLILETQRAIAPQPVQTQETLVFSRAEGKYDFLSGVINPQTHWWVTFRYQFQIDQEGTRTPLRTGYLLPGQTKPLTEMGWINTSTQITTAQLNISDLRWHRTLPSVTQGDYSAFLTKRFLITIDNVTYTTEEQTDKTIVGKSTFLVRNASGYGYWSLPLTLILSRTDGPAAVATLVIDQLKPGEQRTMEWTWFQPPVNVLKTDVTADINVFDPDTFLPTNRIY